jgi:hypothetical protein
MNIDGILYIKTSPWHHDIHGECKKKAKFVSGHVKETSEGVSPLGQRVRIDNLLWNQITFATTIDSSVKGMVTALDVDDASTICKSTSPMVKWSNVSSREARYDFFQIQGGFRKKARSLSFFLSQCTLTSSFLFADSVVGLEY